MKCEHCGEDDEAVLVRHHCKEGKIILCANCHIKEHRKNPNKNYRDEYRRNNHHSHANKKEIPLDNAPEAQDLWTKKFIIDFDDERFESKQQEEIWNKKYVGIQES